MVKSVLLSPLKNIPLIGELIDSSTEGLLCEFQNKKEQELVNVILLESDCITAEMVNDIEFIVNFNKTLEAVRRLATNDKIKFFGNLIRNGYLKGNHIENSMFEEYLDILNSMSYREIECLIAYKEWLDNHPPELRVSINLWQEFRTPYSIEQNISTTELENIFIGLTRTGFVNTTYREDIIHLIGYDDTDEQKKREEEENKRAISYVYDINLSLRFNKFYSMVLKSL